MKCQRCGKENPAEFHIYSPLALRLADALDGSGGPLLPITQAAAELRRLHLITERNEILLRQMLNAIERGESFDYLDNTIAPLLRESLGEKE